MENGKEHHQKETRILSLPNPQNPWKRREKRSKKKETPAREKSKEIPKKNKKGRTGRPPRKISEARFWQFRWLSPKFSWTLSRFQTLSVTFSHFQSRSLTLSHLDSTKNAGIYWLGRQGKTTDAAFLLTVGSFLLTMELFYLQLCLGALLLTVGASLLTIEVFLTYRWEVQIRSTLMDCKQRSSTVSKKLRTVSKKLPPEVFWRRVEG